LLFDFHLASSRPFDPGLLCMSFIVPGLTARRISASSVITDTCVAALAMSECFALVAQWHFCFDNQKERAGISPARDDMPDPVSWLNQRRQQS
jgi:hypothetical protein